VWKLHYEARLLWRVRIRWSKASLTDPLDSGGVTQARWSVIAVHTDQVSLEEAREAGPVHVGHQMWSRLG